MFLVEDFDSNSVVLKYVHLGRFFDHLSNKD